MAGAICAMIAMIAVPAAHLSQAHCFEDPDRKNKPFHAFGESNYLTFLTNLKQSLAWPFVFLYVLGCFLGRFGAALYTAR